MACNQPVSLKASVLGRMISVRRSSAFRGCSCSLRSFAHATPPCHETSGQGSSRFEDDQVGNVARPEQSIGVTRATSPKEIVDVCEDQASDGTQLLRRKKTRPRQPQRY